MAMVPVYEDGVIIATVEYNHKLDRWDGHDFTNGGLGRHLGITKLEDGRFVLIYGTQFEGEKDYAEVATDEEALQEILKSGNEELLDEPKYAELKELMDKKMIKEV